MKKTLLLMVSLLMGVNAAWADPELTAVSTETTWDFTSMSFSSSALETAQYLQDNTIYLGPGVIKNGRAAFSSALDAMPTALGNNMVAFKAGADGQCLIMVSTYRGYVSVSDGTSVVVDYNATGDTYHDGGKAYYRHVFSVAAGKTYYIYTTNIASLNNGISDVGVIKMDYRPIGVNTTTAFSSTEVVNINVNANFPQIAYQGITYDNVYVGQGVVYTNSRHTFGGATSGDTKNPTTYAFSFKLPAGKGSLYIDPSSWHNTSNYVKLSNGEEILLHMGKAAHHSESGDAAIAARTYAYESSTETTMYVYSTASGDGYGLYGITWTPTTHTYTINAVDGSGNLLQQLTSATCIEGGSYSFVGVPKVVSKDGKYYVLNDANVSGYTTPDYIMGSEDETKSITYSEDPTIIYFSEVENLSNHTSGTQGNFSGEYHAAINSGRGGELTTFEPGNYQVEGYIVDHSNRGLYLRSGTSNTNENIITYIGNLSGQQTSNFSLASSTTLYLTGFTSPSTNQVNQSADIDYIIIRRTNVTPTIGADGYATYSSPYPLDFEHATDVRGYYATTASEGTVLMTRVSGTAAANEGLFLQKTGETPTIPILASGSTLTGNLLKPTTGSNIYDTSDSKIQYVFAKQNSELGFYKVVDELSPTAGKAYLEVTSAIAASRLRFIFEDDEETTGIESRECKSADRNFYNLSGQRILQPRQGLYIVGGKKVIIK